MRDPPREDDQPEIDSREPTQADRELYSNLLSTLTGQSSKLLSIAGVYKYAPIALATFLSGTGETQSEYVFPVEDFFKAVPPARKIAAAEVVGAAAFATRHLRRTGDTSVWFSSSWESHAFEQTESPDWFGVYRGWHYGLRGWVTCQNDAEFSMTLQFTIFKEFNFDANEKYPFPVSSLADGSSLQGLHASGLARNFEIKAKKTLSVTWRVPKGEELSDKEASRIFHSAEYQLQRKRTPRPCWLRQEVEGAAA